MSLRSVLILVLALVLGVSAAIGIGTLTVPALAPAGDTVPVVVAADHIPRGRKLTDDTLTTRDYPRHLVPPGAITRLEDARDRVTSTRLLKDEPIHEGRLAAKGAGRGIDTFIPKGMQAITLAQLGPFFYPSHNMDDFIGTRLDVLLTLNDQSADKLSGGGSTIPLVQNVEVLDYTVKDVAGKATEAVKELKSVTLLVTPDQAARLTLAQNKGTLNLTLRNPQDAQPTDTRAVTLADFRFGDKPWQGMAAATAEGMRAFAIRVKATSAIAGFIVPGNKVDVLFTLGLGSDEDRGGNVVTLPLSEVSTTTLLQNVEILSAEFRVDAPAQNKGAPNPDGNRNDPKIDPTALQNVTVTLQVAPDQAAKLALAQNTGKLHLALRNVKDSNLTGTPPVTVAALRPARETPAAPAPAATPIPPLPPPPLQIRTLRGTQEGGVLIYPLER